MSKNVVPSVLPLSKAALRVALSATNLSGCMNQNVLGSSNANFPKQLEIIRSYFKNDTSSYIEEQRKVEKLAKALRMMDNKSDNNAWAPNSAAALGFCAKEFRRFLSKVDPTDNWCGLRVRISSEGHAVFVCQFCQD